MANIGSNSFFRDAFIEGAAKAFFVTAYADFVEEGYSTDNDLTDDERKARIALPKAGGGQDWYDYAPEPPPEAYALAGELWARLESENGHSVYTLASHAAKADGVEEIDVEEFGRDLAMQAMGHGVSWFDDHENIPNDLLQSYKSKRFEIPDIECNQCSFDDAAFGL